jgi:hypothetical protein
MGGSLVLLLLTPVSWESSVGSAHASGHHHSPTYLSTTPHTVHGEEMLGDSVEGGCAHSTVQTFQHIQCLDTS